MYQEKWGRIQYAEQCVQFMLLNFSFSTTEPCNVKITGTCIYEALQYPDDFLLMCCPETVSCSLNAWTQCLISDSSFTKLGTGLSHSICPSLYFEERKKITIQLLLFWRISPWCLTRRPLSLIKLLRKKRGNIYHRLKSSQLHFPAD